MGKRIERVLHCYAVCGALLCAAAPAAAQTAPDADQPIDLHNLSIEQLSQMEVTSVSKAPQTLSAAPAAVYVITRDDIRRSGATTIPEMLRLAPNLEVFQTSASDYVITARGFSGNSAAQSFSNKLLVLIDGRSVYTPLFSGVYWDMQNVLPENIERIEVISGPGATLWGANAVNGVINIITRSAAETQGLTASLSGGTFGASASIQYGGRTGDLTYRAYLQDYHSGETEFADGASAHDRWDRPQGGFRLDWAPPGANAFTVQGDAYAGSENQLGAGDENIAGRNLLGRWTRNLNGGAELQLQAYYDYTERHTEDGGGRLQLNTYDVDMQHSFGWGTRNDIIWGGGVRLEDYRIEGSSSGLDFDPSSRRLTLANLFVQDNLALAEALHLTLGLKAESDPYSGVAWLPSARLSWARNNGVLIWGAVSRAVRSPTPFDEDVQESVAGTLILSGNREFQTEKLTAYEAGLRIRPNSASSLSISAFHNDYDDLRTIEFSSGPAVLTWGNGMQGSTDGVEIWADYDVTNWWRLSAAYAWLHEDLGFSAGASGILGPAQAGDDPAHRASLTSLMTFGPNVSFNASLRYVGALPDPRVPSYVELNSRVSWAISEHAEIALVGFNLLHDRHQELPAPATSVPRQAMVELRLRY